MKNVSKNQTIITIIFIAFLVLFQSIPLMAFSSDIPSLRPIPLSPPSAEKPSKEKSTKEINDKRTEYSKKYAHSDGYFINTFFPRTIHKRGKNGGWEDIEEKGNENSILPLSNPTPLSLCLYAAGASFDQSGVKSPNELNLYHYTSGETTLKSDTYLRYPHLRDLIPSTGTLSQVSIVIPDEVPNSSSFTVAAYAILDSWNPSTVTGENLPQVSLLSSGQNQLDLNPNTPRSQRSIDITTLAEDWFEGTQSDFGLVLAIPSPSQTQNGVTGLDLPLLIVKYAVPEVPADPAFGGSYYSDNMTPPVLIPGRAIFVDRIGDLENQIQSFVFTKYDMNTIIPFGEDTATVVMQFPDTFLSGVTVPIDKPKPYSNSCFQTYTFPPLNGDPANNGDIYQNYALTATLPQNDPAPVGLLPSPPYLSDSYQFINLGGDANRDPFVDITALVNTPISSQIYPNYPLQQFTSVVKVNHELVTPQVSYQCPLSSLPTVVTISSPDIGADGELENRKDNKVITGPINISPVIINPIGNISIPISTKMDDVYLGNKGCLGIVFKATYEISLRSQYDFSAFNAIGEKISLIGLPPPSNTVIIGGQLFYISSSGSKIPFKSVLNSTGTPSNTYYSEKITNMRIIMHDENPPALRYELSTQNGGLSRWFDAEGRLTQITSVEGGLIRYNRDQINPDKVLSMEDVFSGRKCEITYDGSDRVVEVKDPINRQLQFQYDANNQLTRWIDPMSRSVWFGYDAQGNVTSLSYISPSQLTPKTLYSFSYGLPLSSCGPKTYEEAYMMSSSAVTITNSCGLSTELEVDNVTRRATMTFPSGATVEYGYYHDGTLQSVSNESMQEEYEPNSEQASSATKKMTSCEDPGNPNSGKETEIEYDDDRQVIEVTDADNNTTSYAYDIQHRLTSITDSEGKITTTTYLENGLIGSETTESGKSIIYLYDEDKQVISKTLTYKDNQPVTYAYTHDNNGYIDSITDPLDKVTEVTFDNLGRLAQSTDPLGKSIQYTYDYDSMVTNIQVSKDATERNVQMRYNDIGQLVAVEDEAGHITSYIYDECGRLQAMTNPLNQSTQYEYDTSGNLKKVIDAKNHATEYTYDIHGRMTSVKDPAGKITSYQYNTEGKLIQVTDPLQHSVQYEYDILGRITKIKDPLNHETTYTYSPLGKVLTVTDANQHTYTMEYNDDDQLTKVTNPLNQSTQYEYYPFGAVKKVINPNNQFVTYDYDEAFRMISTTDIQNRTTTYTYDDADRVISVTDSANRTTSYEYDLFSNVIEVTNPLNQTTQFEYDECNNQTAIVSPMNERYTFAYDALHRKVSSTDPLSHTRYYTYDQVGNLSTFEDPLEHVTSFQHDVRDLLDKTTDALEQDTLYTYDDACRLNQLTDELQRVTTFQLDAASQMTSVTSPLSRTVSLTYDAIGSLLTVTRPATTGNNPTNAPVDEFSYDTLDRLATVTDPLDNDIDYAYNVLSQITQIECVNNFV